MDKGLNFLLDPLFEIKFYFHSQPKELNLY